MTMKKTKKGNNLFWLDDLQWSMLEPHLPTKQTRPKRKDDRRIISGIIHVRQSGCRWQDCPPNYGPSTTVYNRYHRWAKRGIWEGMFRDLTSVVGTHYENSIDSTIVKAHRSASGKRGRIGSHRPEPGRAHDENPCRNGPARPPDSLPAHAGQCRRHQDGKTPTGTAQDANAPAGRKGL